MILLSISTAFFIFGNLLAAWLYWRYSRRLESSLLTIARATQGFVLLYQLITLSAWGGSLGLGNIGDFFVRHLMFLIAGFVLWLISFRRSRLLIVLVGLPLLSAGLVANHFLFPVQVELNLPSYWVWTHVLFMLLGEVVFFIAAIASAIFLIAEFRLKNKDLTSLFAKIPSLELFDRILGRLLPVGFSLLTIGIVLGVIFSKQYWDANWFTDPKVIMTFLTWGLYAFLILKRRFSPNFSGRQTALMALFGFLAIIFLSWGLNFVFQSRHDWTQPRVERFP